MREVGCVESIYISSHVKNDVSKMKGNFVKKYHLEFLS